MTCKTELVIALLITIISILFSLVCVVIKYGAILLAVSPVVLGVLYALGFDVIGMIL